MSRCGKLGEIIEEYDSLMKSNDILNKITALFDYKGDNADFVEHMQKWKDAQPLTNMSVIDKLDELWGLADEVNSSARGLEEECETAQASIEECSYYNPSSDAEDLQRQIKHLMDEIQNPKEQAEADMEDGE